MNWMILQRWSLLQRDLSMAVGKVKWFNNAKGFGFINTDAREGRDEDGKEIDFFAHFSQIKMDGYKTLKAGQAVVFSIIQGPKGLHATDIQSVITEPSSAVESAAVGAAAAAAAANAKAMS
jgi:CspA family cold shock protein